MNSKRRTGILSATILFELIAIGALLFWVQEKREAVTLQEASPMAQETITASSTKEFPHFYELTPGVVDNFQPPWLDAEPHNTINSDTLNERFEYETKKPERTYRIVTLGDSWVYGQFVSTTQNFSEQLEVSLNTSLECSEIDQFEVINLGVGSYDIAYAAERFKRRGAKYDPDLVIWFLISNDFEEINEFIRPRVKEHQKALEARREELTYDEYEGLDGIFVETSDPVAALSWSRAVEDQFAEMSEAEMTKYQREHLERVPKLHDGPLLMYTLARVTGLYDRGRSVLANFVDQHSRVSWYRSALEFDRERDQLPDSHPNATGHRKIAGDLFGYLTTNEYFDCTVR